MGIEIRTERLRLRPLETADAAPIRALCGEFAVARWLARVPHPYPEGEAERFIAAQLEGKERTWAIERLAEPGLIGMIGIEGGVGEEILGYWLGTHFWGQGYAGEAVRAVVDRAFRETGIACLVSGAFEGNDASLRVQEKLGFAVTGRRMAPCFSVGADRPHIDTALSRTSWEARA
jgi:RimJ/RimL family protein N-acetyltransferase